MLRVHMSEKKHLFGVWITINYKTMDDLIFICIGVVCFIMFGAIYHTITWNPFKENEHPDINADYYEWKKKPDDDGEEV